MKIDEVDPTTFFQCNKYLNSHQRLVVQQSKSLQTLEHVVSSSRNVGCTIIMFRVNKVFGWRGGGERRASGLAAAAVSETGKPSTWAVLCHVFHFWHSTELFRFQFCYRLL